MKKINVFVVSALLNIWCICGFAQTWSALATGVNHQVVGLAVYDSVLYAGGYFSYAGGHFADNIARWDGIAWDSVGVQPTSSGRIGSLAVYNSKLYFNDEVSGVDEWNGTAWSSIGGSNGGPLGALTVYNGELYAGWQGTPYSTVEINKWNGTAWSNVGSGISGSGSYAIGRVGVLTVYNGELYAGGWFTQAGGIAVNNIAKWNGTTWTALPTGVNHPIINAMCVYNGELYIGGASANYISKWNGTTLDSINSGINGSVKAFCVYNGELYVGGTFTTAGGNPANNIAKWNGTTWSAIGSGVDSASVDALCVYKGELYVGGSFIMAGGISANNIAKVNYTTGLQQFAVNKEQLNIYPNPTCSKIQVTLASNYKAEEIILLDMLGNEVLSTKETTIDVSNLQGGVYFVQAKTMRGVATNKVIIQR